ncbi:hypothetical protein N7450_000008 [Penicillium hetheringtonii]|uniref:Uncharacterized protein n=1 Tax=Penicillium hetheringtonii TaxID=911720 RepID=A0AAD6E1E4_9EURO|nr:hypothetical protein N7450_000008 [Penicillium hetheringtonii]
MCLGFVFDLSEQFSRYERRAIGGQNAVIMRLLLESYKGILLDRNYLKYNLEDKLCILDGCAEILNRLVSLRLEVRKDKVLGEVSMDILNRILAGHLGWISNDDMPSGADKTSRDPPAKDTTAKNGDRPGFVVFRG